MEHFSASEGARVATRVGSELQQFNIPSITPRLTEHGCVFLEDGRCTIHEVSPFGCAYFRVCDDTDADAMQKSRELVLACAKSFQTRGDYARTWQALSDAGRLAPPLQQRTATLRETLEELDNG